MLWRVARWARPHLTLRASVLFAAAATLSPSVLVAQQSADSTEQRTHTVKKKDTLWDLAQAYLGDAFQWPEIYKINRDVVEDPHWIYPGEILKIPGKGPVMATIADATPAVAPTDEAKPKQEVKDTVKPQVEIPTSSAAPQPAAEPPGDPDAPLIFVQAGQRREAPEPMVREPRESRESRSAYRPARDEGPPTTIRFGEFLAAPYVDQRGGPRGAGRLVERADLSALRAHEEQRFFQVYDRVLISPPVANMAPEGERFISYTFGPYLEDIGQVIIPTGIVEVSRAPRRGEYAVAKVIRIFSEMRPDQRLMPYDSSALMLRGRPQGVADGRWASVKWISSEPVMPSIQNYLVLNLSGRDGVQLGDEFELFRPRRPASDAGRLAKPEIPIGKAQVVRVTPYAVTVIVTGQEQPKIENGMMARISAKMP